MNISQNGISQCERGQEQWKRFYARGRRVQYDYRIPDGELFSVVGESLGDCRRRRDDWLARASHSAPPAAT